jgi:hypothetical protein
MAGRPTLCTPERVEKILALIGEGNTRRCAAECNGIAYDTLKQWLRLGKAGQEPYATFATGVQKAEAEAEAWHVGNIKRHAEQSFAASAWWLERVRFKTYAKRDVSYERERRMERLASKMQLEEIPLADLEAMVAAEKRRRGIPLDVPAVQ